VTGIQPTESDGEWVTEALDGLVPLDSLDSVWQFEGVRDQEDHAVNKFRQRGTQLVVLVAINPIQVKDDDDAKKVSYHVTICREQDNKIKKPNQADISRARSAFFLRDLTPEEKVHEGTIGDSRAHHILAVVDHKPRIINPSGGFF
jgi:hypothetical protein